ncbi:hypothetical protein AAT19DRAFT_9796 [Rhodotorula toruloides]|uniref:Uncharacterized protein n=1 Tax=Rhodotorula toruloides TaxID=5286 RepID=A0A2T0A119_RHOTO|nr:hypothetical protein AAT19DRAFT_9796 [Rhodotorula toruloides]
MSSLLLLMAFVSCFVPLVDGRCPTQDWGVVDPRSGIFTADTRYNAVLSDGSDLYFNTFGPKTQDGSLHLHIKIETGSAAYYHLNHIVAVGVLHNLGHDDLNVSTLRIDAFDFKTDYTNLTLLH